MPDLQPMTIWAATPETPLLLNAVADERVRQVEKGGVQTRPDGTGGEMATILADLAKNDTDRAAADGTLTWKMILEEEEVAEAFAETDPAALRDELVQVAAVALSWAEDLDRKAEQTRTLRKIEAEADRTYDGKGRVQ